VHFYFFLLFFVIFFEIGQGFMRFSGDAHRHIVFLRPNSPSISGKVKKIGEKTPTSKINA